MNLLLKGEAADWIEILSEISIILAETSTSESLQRFLTLFKERFSIKFIIVITIIFSKELENLR